MGTRNRLQERGAAAVEFALVVPILLMLLIGMVTGAFAVSDHLSITNAVREGARYGAAVDATSGGWATSVRDRVKQTYFNAGGTVSDSQICVQLVPAGSATPTYSAMGGSCGTAPGNPADMAPGSCVVKVWVTKPQSMNLVVAGTLNFDIGAESVAYYGRKLSATCTAD